MVQKQWRTLRGQFTREHRLAKMYEPSGTGNDTKRPRKTWYLYESLLFLAPHVAHRNTSSNFVRKSTVMTQSAALNSFSEQPQSASGSPLNTVWNVDLFHNDSDVTSLPERSASSTSSLSSVSSSVGQPKSLAKRNSLLTPPPDQYVTKRLNESQKEQEQLSKMIGKTTEAISTLVDNLTKKSQFTVSDDNEEEATMAKTFVFALKRVPSKYKTQCYMQCLSVIDKCQNMDK